MGSVCLSLSYKGESLPKLWYFELTCSFSTSTDNRKHWRGSLADPDQHYAALHYNPQQLRRSHLLERGPLGDDQSQLRRQPVKSGKKQTLKAGDLIVQRATMHRFVNVTPAGGWVKMIGFSSGIADLVKVGGKELETEFRF